MAGYDPTEALDAIINDVAGLHETWRLFNALFAHTEARVNVLNVDTGELFGRIEDYTGHALLLAISRLTDPPADKAGHQSLSVRRVVDDLELLLKSKPPPQNENEVRAGVVELRQELALLDTLVKPIRKHRNTYIAHASVKVRLQPQSVAGIPRQTIIEAIDGISGIVGRVLTLREQRSVGWDTASRGAGVEWQATALHALLAWGLERATADRGAFIEAWREANAGRLKPPAATE